MDVKVINEQMAFNLRHFLINFKSKTYMYEVDPLPNLPKAVYFYLGYILTKLGDTRLLINQFPNSFYSFALKYFIKKKQKYFIKKKQKL